MLNVTWITVAVLLSGPLPAGDNRLQSCGTGGLVK